MTDEFKFSIPLPKKKAPSEVDRFLARQLDHQAHAALTEGLARLLGGATNCAEASAARIADDRGRMRDCVIAARASLVESIEYLDSAATFLDDARKASRGDVVQSSDSSSAGITEGD